MKNRSGSYKKVLIDESQLVLHRETLLSSISKLQSTQLSPFEFCTLYVILFLRLKHPKNWLQRKSHLITPSFSRKIEDLIPSEFALNEWEKNKLSGVTFDDLFLNFNLKGIPLATNTTMLKWSQDLWPICLLHHIPSPRELLKMQANGSRCITLIVNPDEITKMVLQSRDPLSFVIHDLDHANNFFSNANTHLGQIGFLQLVDAIYDLPELNKNLKENSHFKEEINYVASDMNAYVIHMFKCFKSAIDRQDQITNQSLFGQVIKWWNMPPEVSLAAYKLSTPSFNEQDENFLRLFFENKTEVLI